MRKTSIMVIILGVMILIAGALLAFTLAGVTSSTGIASSTFYAIVLGYRFILQWIRTDSSRIRIIQGTDHTEN